MTAFGKSVLGATAAAAILAFSAGSASAAIACSGNVCWHTHERYHYPRSARIVIHSDSWRGGPRVTFREHDGRGYWRRGRWVEW